MQARVNNRVFITLLTRSLWLHIPFFQERMQIIYYNERDRPLLVKKRLYKKNNKRLTRLVILPHQIAFYFLLASRDECPGS